MAKKENNKKSLPILVKILIASGILLAMFVLAYFLKETAVFGSYRLFLKRAVYTIFYDGDSDAYSDEKRVESDDFSKADKDIPFSVPKPQWLPEGYVLDYVNYSINEAEDYNIEYGYSNEDEQILFNIVVSSSRKLSPSDFSVKYEQEMIDDYLVYFVPYGDEGASASYTNNQGFIIIIMCEESKESLIKIIKNMS